MRVLVTGSAGRLGRWVVREFVAAGWSVVAVDQAVSASADTRQNGVEDLVEYHCIRLTNARPLVDVMGGCTAVVHLAAIPTPTLGSREEVFANNTLATFAVLEAAAQVSVRRAAIASSTSAYGMAFAESTVPPHYVPIDEAHPLVAADAYALSKETSESTARMFHRLTGMSIAALRFHWVAAPGEAARRAASREADTEFQIRRQWGWVDVRDAAAACRLAVTVDGIGCEAFNIVAPDILSELPADVLLDRHFPTVPRRRALTGTDSLFSSAKAARMLGWTARYRWSSQ